MAKLAIQPIKTADPVNHAGRMLRTHTDTRVGFVNRATGAAGVEVAFSVKNAQNQQAALIKATYAGSAWVQFEVDLSAEADAITAARLNKLLEGTSMPKVEKYFRTGTMVLRAKGRALPLPVHVSILCNADGSYASMQFSTPAQPQPAAAPLQTPQYPSATPAPAPNTPQAQAQALRSQLASVLAGIQTPDASPETSNPEPEPVEVIVSARKKGERPECKCPAGECLFTYPDLSTTNRIISSPLNQAALNAAVKKHRRGKRATVALVGPKGTGKTELVWDAAARAGVGLFIFDGAGATSFADWTGATGLSADGNGGTVTKWVPTAFIEAIRQDGPHGDEERWVLIDEFNRVESSGALNALIPMLSAGTIYIPETGHTIRISRNVMFLFTLNRGSNYNATVQLDAALSDRVQTWLRTEYLSATEETKLVIERTGIGSVEAGLLVKAAHQLRAVADRGEISEGISTRRVLDAADGVKDGLRPVQAAEVSWANYYPDEGGAEGERGTVLTAIRATMGA